MPIRTPRGFRMSLPARLTTMLTLVAAALPFINAAPASATATCPRPAVGKTWYDIYSWHTMTPPESDPNGWHGVAICEGINGLGTATQGWLHVADLAAGGRLRVWTKADPSTPIPDYTQPDTIYQKMSANGWYTFIQNKNRETTYNGWQWPPTYPDAPYLPTLVSVVNAAFFKDSDTFHGTTKLPLPHWGFNGDPSYPQNLSAPWTLGVAAGHMDDNDYLANHRALLLGDPIPHNFAKQQAVRLKNIPPYYSANDIWNTFANVGGYVDPSDALTYDAVAGFDENYQIGDRARRNYLGVNGTKVYMFTSEREYTNAEAVKIMRAIDPYMTIMQLDGGGSAQFYGPYAEMDSNVPLVGREVPSVIAFYQGFSPLQ